MRVAKSGWRFLQESDPSALRYTLLESIPFSAKNIVYRFHTRKGESDALKRVERWSCEIGVTTVLLSQKQF